MPELMTVTVEVWPLAADDAGLWLLSDGDAWRFGPVEATSDVHYEVELLLFQHGIDPGDAVFIRVPADMPQTGALHSTSWRPHGPTIVLTYMAVVKAGGYVRERWPAAGPSTPRCPRRSARPRRTARPRCPYPDWSTSPLTGLRHLRFLMDYDAETSAALDENWRRHLVPLETALFTMFSER